ncbi:hypothetical protein HK103_001426 [Boothiomyces macroporosus]|uniref:MARVEL domain-containing protein n=1 Tax=Boothiomyces macroporosus TaxID=261099 RepID=A0AAD5UDY2_9FUNG|nr:hypothetical protein HK103_001426 [Boothiomyces macroporosus]
MVSFKNIQKKWDKAKKWDYEQTLRKVKDTANFEIDKSGRFAGRFFQIALSLISYYWLGAQNSVLVAKYGLASTNNAMIFFAIISPIVSGLLIAVYITPWFGKNWTSRRILSIETFFDLFMMMGWICGFGVELTSVGTGCSLQTWIDGCTSFNWLAAWLFFLFVAWAAGLFFDCTAWYRGVFAGNEIDADVLLDIRRSGRQTRR